MNLRGVVGTSKRRGVFNVIVAGHVLGHDGDLVALVLGEQQGRRQANDTGTSLMLASRLMMRKLSQTYPTTTIVLDMTVADKFFSLNSSR